MSLSSSNRTLRLFAAASGASALGYYLYKLLTSRSSPSSSSSPTSDHIPNAEAIAADLTSFAAANGLSNTQLLGSVASASGKVLLTGGYLILEQEFTGLVLALSARFHTSILALNDYTLNKLDLASYTSKNTANESSTVRRFPIVVWAPQRSEKPLKYEIELNGLGLKDANHQRIFPKVSLRSLNPSQEKNKFVEYSIFYSMQLLSSLISEDDLLIRLNPGWIIYLNGDYQFYSSTPPDATSSSSSSSSSSSTTMSIPTVVPDGSKTGLGSSAALTSSLIAALFQQYSMFHPSQPPIISIPSQFNEHSDKDTTTTTTTTTTSTSTTTSLLLSLSERQNLCYNLCQFVHCLAQGKVGSGFDISAAFFGSQRYRRFSEQCIVHLLKTHETQQTIPRADLVRTLLPAVPTLTSSAATSSSSSSSSSVYKSWDHEVLPFSLPHGLALILGDVCGGASTPTMVKSVLQWRAANKNTSQGKIWNELALNNNKFEQLLRHLQTEFVDKHFDKYEAVRKELALLPSHKWNASTSSYPELVECFRDIATTFNRIRFLLRRLGDHAQVGIEPSSQTELLDVTSTCPGVLAAGVPGAGGEDAIFVLMLDDSCRQQVIQKWNAFNQTRKSQVQLLPVYNEKAAILTEPVRLDVKYWPIFQ